MTKITIDKAVLEQALEALEAKQAMLIKTAKLLCEITGEPILELGDGEAIAALRQALEQPRPAPPELEAAVNDALGLKAQQPAQKTTATESLCANLLALSRVLYQGGNTRISDGELVLQAANALAEQNALSAQQEPVAWISVKDALPKAARGVSYKASLTDVVLVRHSDRPDYPITAHAVVGENLGAGVAIPTDGASEHPEIAWYSTSSNLNNPFDLKNDNYDRYMPKIFGSKITHWMPLPTHPQAREKNT